MAGISEEAEKHRPKRPLNSYMRYRQERLAHYKGTEGANKKAQEDWNNIDPALKTKMDAEFEAEKEQYKLDHEAWMKKFKLTEDDLKEERSEKRETKVEKSKGGKSAKEAEKKVEKKDEKKKEEKKEEKNGRSKSKDEKSKEKGGKDKSKDVRGKSKK